MQSVIILSIHDCEIMLCVITHNVVILDVFLLGEIKPSIFTLRVVVQCHYIKSLNSEKFYAKRHYAECHYSKFHYIRFLNSL